MRTERHEYKFTNKNNTRGGIISAILAVVALITVAAGVIISYKNSGAAGTLVGGLGTMSFLLAIVGLICGLKSFKEKDKFYVFSWIGTISNGILWLGMCLIIAKGFMLW